MRIIENFELVLAGKDEERLILTFDWNDVVQLPRAATSISFDPEGSVFTVAFEDTKHWEEIQFVNVPLALHDMIKQFNSILVLGLSDDTVELNSDLQLQFK